MDGNKEKIKLYTFYTPSHKNLFERWFLPSINKNDFDLVVLEAEQKGNGVYKSNGWNESMMQKVDFVIKAIKENQDKVFIYSDCDVQFLNSPYQEVKSALSTKDIVFQQDEYFGKMACAGFFAAKGSQAILKLWQEVKNRLEKNISNNFKADDQDKLNEILKEKPTYLNWSFFSKTKFFCPRMVWNDGDNISVPFDILIHHANWTNGLKNKELQLKYVRDKYNNKSGLNSPIIHYIAVLNRVMVGMFIKMLKKIKRITDLSFQMAKVEFKLRNEGTYLGIFWYLLNPILFFILLYFIFSDRLGGSIVRYPLYLIIGIIMFNLFQNTVIDSVRATLKDYGKPMKAINFPKEAIIGGTIIKNLFSHLFEIFLLFLALVFFNLNPFYIFLYILILVPFVFFIFGISALFSALTVYFKDMDNMLNFAMKILWIATPIFYSIAGQKRLFFANLFNPLYYFITIMRDAVIYNVFSSGWIFMGAVAFAVGFFFLGLFIFNKLKYKFAELI